jgi:hypothetical protein
LRWLNPLPGKRDGSLTAINAYWTCTEPSCHLLELEIYKERADIEDIKSSLFIEKNSTADCWGVIKNLEPQTH